MAQQLLEKLGSCALTAIEHVEANVKFDGSPRISMFNQRQTLSQPSYMIKAKRGI